MIRKSLTVNIEVKVNLANCIFALAFFVSYFI